ncbi:hypothetical protein FOPE_10871 [Fonsecaea pedrosoi]|nr:hypothetical protein FOPE_10871 [Fonsecaea pedrosoi]
MAEWTFSSSAPTFQHQPNPIMNYSAPQPTSQQQQKPVNPQHAKLNALFGSGEGQDTFGNTGDLRLTPRDLPDIVRSRKGIRDEEVDLPVSRAPQREGVSASSRVLSAQISGGRVPARR